MSFQAVTSFFELVAADSELRDLVQAALDHRAEAAAFEIADLGAERECEFTATELREYLAAQSADAELSDEQLAVVAGGVLQVRALNLSGIRKIRQLPIDALRARRLGRRGTTKRL